MALGGLSVEIATGEVFGLLGPNGAGKTTALLMLAGLVRPTDGAITIFGHDLRGRFLDVAPRMGVLVDHPAFYDHLTARQNLAILAKLSGKDVNLDRALDRVGLLRVAATRAGRLSRGMRQRLGLAQALLSEPELLLLDEPTNGLDPEASQEVLQLLRRLATEGGVTIVLSSHLLHEVEGLCSRVAILNEGRLLACEETDQLLSYDPTLVEVLIDSPEAAARRLSEEPWVQEVASGNGRIHVRLADGTVHQLTSFLVGAGYRLSGVIPHRRTLQDYFLKVLNR